MTKKEYENISREEKIDILEYNLIQDFINIRKENRYSQQQLAAKCQVIRTTVARIETYITSPQIKTMIDLLEPLGYTLSITKIDKRKLKNKQTEK